jgi:hypothetical protein
VSHLEQRLAVTCPLAQADARLGEFFREYGNSAGDTARLTLRVSVGVPGLVTPLTLHRTVVATIQPHRLPADTTPRYTVQWAPETPGPFPLFAGELAVESGDDYDSFTLRLDGNYTPPLGLIGKGFDIAVGNRIARATANDLLHTVRASIERHFQANEARKHQTIPHSEES